MCSSPLRAGTKVISAPKNKSIRPAKGLLGRRAPLATVFTKPCEAVNQWTIKLVSVRRVRRVTIATVGCTMGDQIVGKNRLSAPDLTERRRFEMDRAGRRQRFGIVNVWPGWIMLPEIPFSLLIADTEAPVLLAIPERVSPFFTV